MDNSEDFARLRAHRNNIKRYRQLLETKLTELERQYVIKRLSEEQSAIEVLSTAILPLILKNQSAESPTPRTTLARRLLEAQRATLSAK
jgi:hypothetical protein